MKKLLIVLSALVLAVGFAAPAFAADKEATWGGELGFGGITMFDETKKSSAFTDAYFDATIPIDDYNEAVFELAAEGFDTPVPYYKAAVVKLVTDVGEYAGLPVGLKNSFGYFGYDSKEFGVTGHARERKYRPGTGGAPATLFEVDFGAAQLGVDITWEEGAMTQDYAALLSIPEVGPAAVEVSVWVLNNDDFDMVITANAEAKGIADMPLDFAVGFGLDSEVIAYAEWWYGVGAAYVLADMAKIGVSLNGEKDIAIDQLAFDVDAMLGDDYGLEAGLGLNLDEDAAETFAGVSVSAYYKPGASKWSVGYLHCNDGAYDYGAPCLNPAPSPDERGGVFIKCDIDI